MLCAELRPGMPATEPEPSTNIHSRPPHQGMPLATNPHDRGRDRANYHLP